MVNGTHWAKPFFVLNLENVLSGNSNEHKSAVYHVYVIILFNIVLSHYIYYCAFLRTSLFFQEKKRDPDQVETELPKTVFTPVATWGSLQKQVNLCRLQCKVNQPYSIKKHVYTFPIHNIST